ncbi:MAG: hypothetical protein AAFV53_41480 [Myxococcota bacterium]
MPELWLRILRIVVVYAVCGWMFGILVLKKLGWAAFVQPDPLQAALVAAIVGSLWGILIVYARRWYLGALLALPSAGLTVWLYFVLWPVQNWNISATNATLVILQSYRWYLAPLAILGGAFGAWWAARPLPRPAWLLDDELEPGEETVG